MFGKSSRSNLIILADVDEDDKVFDDDEDAETVFVVMEDLVSFLKDAAVGAGVSETVGGFGRWSPVATNPFSSAI